MRAGVGWAPPQKNNKKAKFFAPVPCAARAVFCVKELNKTEEQRRARKRASRTEQKGFASKNRKQMKGRGVGLLLSRKAHCLFRHAAATCAPRALQAGGGGLKLRNIAAATAHSSNKTKEGKRKCAFAGVGLPRAPPKRRVLSILEGKGNGSRTDDKLLIVVKLQ